MTVLLRDALAPNLVQTLENNPAFVHGGPFANIAHGCNSVFATTTALKLADYVVTEAGFGADLGAEKFFDIKCRKAGLSPSAAVLVATARALKMHGGVEREDDLEQGERGRSEAGPAPISAATRQHREVRRAGGGGDQSLHRRHRGRDRTAIRDFCRSKGASRPDLHAIGRTARRAPRNWRTGGGAGRVRQGAVQAALSRRHGALAEKVRTIAKEIYGAKDIAFAGGVATNSKQFEDDGYRHLPICIAKTQYSFSTDPAMKGAPEGHTMRGARSAAVGGRRLHRGDLRRDHDHARPAARAERRGDRIG